MQRMTLCGAWEMRASDECAWRRAQVPGSVYADLLADGAMEDPFWRDNELKAFPLMRKDWCYRRRFTVPEGLLESRRVLLVCEGLDTLAHVRLNGSAVGDADNMHVTWEWDVKPLLHAGENEIEIDFDSPVNYALAEDAKRPCWGSTDAVPGFSHIRKAHCMFGWDWGPRLPDAGIWRPISLVGVDAGRILSVQVLQHHEADRVTLEVQPEIEGMGLWTAQVTAPDGQVLTADEAGRVVIDQPEL